MGNANPFSLNSLRQRVNGLPPLRGSINLDRALEICYDNSQLERYVAEALIVLQGQPVLIDSFLEDAIEVDVDAIADGERVLVAGVMEHIEEAGVHSGDSACVIPPYSLQGSVVAEIREATRTTFHV